MPTIEDLGKKVKVKYPNTYSDLSDADLGRRVKQKYPGAYDDFAEAQQTRQTKSQAVSQGVKQGLGQAKEAGKGAIKSIFSGVDEISKLGQKGIQHFAKPFMPKQQQIAELPKAITTPSNTDQQAGFLGGQIGQVLATGKPGAKLVKGAQELAGLANLDKYGKAGKILQGGLNLAARAGTEGVQFRPDVAIS
jgi:hypothetical protein